MSGIFISYRRHSNAAAAGRLYDRLSERLGKNRVFMDIDGIEPGEDFIEVLDNKLAGTVALLVVIGRDWLTCRDKNDLIRLNNPGDFVRLEVATALQRNIRVIPILIDDASMPEAEQLPVDLKSLSRRQALQIDHARFNQDVTRLISSLEKLLTPAGREDPHPSQVKAEARTNAKIEGDERVERQNIEAATEHLKAHQNADAERQADDGQTAMLTVINEAAEDALRKQSAEQESIRRAEAERIEKERRDVVARQRAQWKAEAEQQARDRIEAERLAIDRRSAAESHRKRQAEAERIAREKKDLDAKQLAQRQAEAERPAEHFFDFDFFEFFREREAEAWTDACKAHSYTAYESYLKTYPSGKYRATALLRYRELKPFWKKDFQ